MTAEEVKNKIGEGNWKKFLKFMHGQTVGMNKDGSIDYYEYDVNKFLISLRRPLNCAEWD